MQAIIATAFFAGGMSLPNAMASENEFAVVAASDAAYRHLATLNQSGWLSSPSTPVRGPKADTSLTRYEIALEVAKAIFALQARYETGAAAKHLAPQTMAQSRVALRALRDLTSSFRSELKSLGVDVSAALLLCDTLLKPPTQVVPRSVLNTAPVARETVTRASSTGSGLSPLKRETPVEIRIAQRLRINTALSVLSRDAIDPFGDASFRGSGSTRTPVAHNSVSAHEARIGAALGVTDWLTLRAGAQKQKSDGPLPVLSLSPTRNLRHTSSVLGGLDFEVRPGIS
ncbi:MAG TPA: hypothetical protein VF719_06730, partial [Abditibacteriaceae bacterium]